jgi:hypothetical protein
MKRHVWSTTLAIAVAAVVGTAAQTTSTADPRASSLSQSQSIDTITVTGCLQNGAGPSAGATGSSSAAEARGGGYMLANASPTASGGASGTAATSAGSTSSGTTSSNAGASYMLEGNDSDLQKHVGHRVEITGTLDSRANGGASSTGSTSSGTSGTTSATGSGTGTGSSTSAGSAMASNGGAQPLRVSAVRMIASDCSTR